MANRSTQEVFKAVIKAGYYRDYYGKGVPHMCIALNNAQRDNKITNEERHNAIKVIDRYLKTLGLSKHSTLRIALVHNNMESNFEARKKIYKDWPNRPFPK